MKIEDRPDVDGALAYAFDQLTRNLAPNLTYHNRDHTFADVVPVATRLAGLCDVSAHECALVRTAAAYHDIGWIVQRDDHERIGVQTVRQVLPGYGYSPADIETVSGMIWATRVPQRPQTLLEQIVADADLDSLGRDDFWTRTAALRAEQETSGEVLSDLAWYRFVLAFMEEHRYFTAPALAERGEQKARHMQELRQRIDALSLQQRQSAS